MQQVSSVAMRRQISGINVGSAALPASALSFVPLEYCSALLLYPVKRSMPRSLAESTFQCPVPRLAGLRYLDIVSVIDYNIQKLNVLYDTFRELCHWCA
jgi:hypothetical protein